MPKTPTLNKGTEVIVLSTYERRKNCTATHTTITAGTWTRGTNETLGAIQCADGRWQYKMRCQTCCTTGSPIATRHLDTWGLTPADVQWQQVNAAATYDPCVYDGCTATPTEYHHFAPRNTFGTDADNWPCLPLCRNHHTEWHQRMDGYQWHRKGIAA